MRYAKNVQIEKIIIHILEPLGQGLVLSDICLPLQNNPDLIEYFVNHIQTSLLEQTTKAAKFRNINPTQTSGICDNILKERVPLTDGSIKLAKTLYAIMANDKRISPADLGICIYTAENYLNQKFLAILKIDPSKVFRHVVLKDDKGNSFVSYVVEPNAFTNERLQKCAFIQSLDPRHSTYDMLLLDRQTRGLGDDRIAQFFSRTFLDSDQAFDPNEYSKRLYKSLLNALVVLQPQLNPAEYFDLDARIRHAVESQFLNIDAWVEQLPFPEEVKSIIDTEIQKEIPDRSIELDQTYSQKLIKYSKFRGDYDFKLDIPASHLNDILASVERIDNDPERAPYYRILLETEGWRRVQ